MKIIYILIASLALSISSCKKCQICTPYEYSAGVITKTPSFSFYPIKVCDKTDIDAYQNGTNFIKNPGTASADTSMFICR